jgi:sugar phosphate isomerase/epimerase
LLPVWLTDTVTLDLDRAVHYTLLWGLEGVVLRTVGGAADRVPHVNEARLKRRLREHELPAAAVDPGLFEQPAEQRGAWMNDLAFLDETASFCERIGCRRIIVGGLPGSAADEQAVDALRRAGDRAARRGCVLAVRNEGEARATAEALAALLEAVGHPAVRACWSPADGLQAGERAAVGAEALRGRVELVVVRDGESAASGWQPEPLGEGAVGWPEVLRGLHASGFDGPLCLDLSAAESARDGLHEATTLIRLMRTAAS